MKLRSSKTQVNISTKNENQHKTNVSSTISPSKSTMKLHHKSTNNQSIKKSKPSSTRKSLQLKSLIQKKNTKIKTEVKKTKQIKIKETTKSDEKNHEQKKIGNRYKHRRRFQYLSALLIY